MDDTQRELNEEQKAYLESFKEAMRSIDEHIKLIKKAPNAYKELVRGGYWSPDIIAYEFALCSRKMCTLSSRLRGYITHVGLLAKSIFDKAQESKEKKEE